MVTFAVDRVAVAAGLDIDHNTGFAATIVGGIGRPYGAIAGGLIIGIATEFSTFWFLPAYKPAVAFALMVVVLVVRPRGLFAEARSWN